MSLISYSNPNSSYSTPVISYGAESNANAKTALVEFVQMKAGKSMEKGDIIYSTTNRGGNFQATVRVKVLGGQTCVGELCGTEREAEQAAAHQVLVQHADELAEMKDRKRKAKEAAPASGEGDGSGIDPQVKCKIHTAVSQLLGRDSTSADIVYEISETPAGNVAQLSLPALAEAFPVEFEGKSWIGDPAASKQGTRLSAANECLQYIMSLPQAASIDFSLAKVPNPNAPKNKGVKKPRPGHEGPWKGGGCKGGDWKGCSKGSDFDSAMALGSQMGMMMRNLMPAAKGNGKGWNGGADNQAMMMGMMQGMMMAMSGSGSSGKGSFGNGSGSFGKGGGKW